MPEKCVLILLDGLGDRAYSELNNQTPLQAAHTPVLDKLAASGCNGLYHATSPGQALPSENAHFAMFGYDMAGFPGRGALEALGAGIELDARDVAVLARFASVREQDGVLFLAKDKPSATEAEAISLFNAVGEYETDGVAVRLTRTHGLYGILRLRGDVSRFVTDTAPILDGRPLSAIKPWAAHAEDRAARKTARVMTSYLKWVWHSLADHPVNLARQRSRDFLLNGIITQRAGQLKAVTPFSECWGLRGLLMASGIIYHGLAAYVGMDAMKVSDTRDPGKDMAERLRLAHDALADYDFIHVHTKRPDEAGHAKDPVFKKQVIESLDRGIGEAVGPLLNNPDVLIIVTADHSTPSAGPLVHSGETVPVTFCGQGVRRDRVEQFDEVSVASGALGPVRGRELMYLILNHLERAKLQGIMDTPADQPFWPGQNEPFRVG